MFEYRKALKASIERNEFGQLLRGEGAYFYEDKLSSGPVDYASALRSIYELYKSDNSIKSLLQDELMKMISEGNEKVIMALTYLMFHLSYVDDGDNSFNIDVQNILNRAKDGEFDIDIKFNEPCDSYARKSYDDFRKKIASTTDDNGELMYGNITIHYPWDKE